MFQQYEKVQKTVNFGALPMFAGVSFAALPIFALVFNSGVADHLLLPTVLLSIGWYMNSTVSVPYLLSIVMGKPELTVRTNTLGLVILLPLTLLLVWRFGLIGAGLSWIAYHLFSYTYFVGMVCKQCLDRSPGFWYIEVAKPFGLAIVTYGPAALVLAAVDPFHLLVALICFGSASVLYCAGAYLLMGPELRSSIRSIPSRVAMASVFGTR
jgi:O-antigen/teichoic acid export membrane protein